MFVVGLTGGIATGKSTVAELFRRHGVPVLDADQVARELTLPGSPALGAIRRRFGPGVFTPDGALDRAALAAVVFADREARRDLEQILHPLVYERLAAELARLEAADPPPAMVVLDIPLLLEVAFPLPLDLTIVVFAPPDRQLARLVAAGMPPEQAAARLAAQMPIEEKARRADLVLDNSGSREELAARFEAELWPQLAARGAGNRPPR